MRTPRPVRNGVVIMNDIEELCVDARTPDQAVEEGAETRV